MMLTRRIAVAALAATLAAPAALAQEPFRIGLILPMTGPSNSTGRQIEAAVKLYMAQKGDTVAGRKIEVIVRDDTGSADITKRLAQELIVNDKASVIAGFGLTPLALAAAPIATQGKTPMVVMAAGTAIITEASPFIARTSFTLPQFTAPMAEWAARNGIRKVVTLVSDYAPGLDSAKTFKEVFTAAGGQVIDELRTPLRSPDFSPFLQKARDLKPDALFLFVPSGQGAQLMKQTAEREFGKAGIRIIATGDVTDDDQLNDMGDVVLGMVNSHHYSASHDSPENKAYVAAFKAANKFRPNFMSVGGYDGMHLIYEALKKTGGKADGAALVEAMKGMAWVSPRGPISIDPRTRDIIQNVYIRKVGRGADGELYNMEFETVKDVKDPVKEAKK
jgi:branched-chain amino acid transport system substrate-binding protein